ncbi:MAG TPA: TSUP family transporter, partial [Polyangiaceae bacterium]
MTIATGALLFFAAVIGGALNSVAGGGSFVAFPALLFAGVPPIPANATNTIALWPGSVASAVAYRRELKDVRRELYP